jgi:type II secretory pathway pseudopilin PulG
MASDPRRLGSSGIAFVEFLVVLFVLLLLFSIAYPQIQGVRTREAGVAASGDFNTLASAARAYRDAQGDWPPDIPTAEGPGPLDRYLPPGFLFVRGGYEVAWERWVVPGGLPPGSDSTSVVAVTFASENRALPREIRRALGGKVPWFTVGDRSTFILDGL